MNDYDQFVDEMVEYFLEHKEYEEDLIYLKKHKRKHLRFVEGLYNFWKFDHKGMDYAVPFLLSQLGRGE